ncbi:hypothetical protein D3C84_995550 [compost metagenome]
MLGVDAHQQVALLHQLVVAHRHVHHFAGDVRSNVDDVGAHPAVAGPRGFHVMHPECAADPYRQGQNQQGGEQAEELFHQSILNDKQSAPWRRTDR